MKGFEIFRAFVLRYKTHDEASGIDALENSFNTCSNKHFTKYMFYRIVKGNELSRLNSIGSYNIRKDLCTSR